MRGKGDEEHWHLAKVEERIGDSGAGHYVVHSIKVVYMTPGPLADQTEVIKQTDGRGLRMLRQPEGEPRHFTLGDAEKYEHLFLPDPSADVGTLLRAHVVSRRADGLHIVDYRGDGFEELVDLSETPHVADIVRLGPYNPSQDEPDDDDDAEGSDAEGSGAEGSETASAIFRTGEPFAG